MRREGVGGQPFYAKASEGILLRMQINRPILQSS